MKKTVPFLLSFVFTLSFQAQIIYTDISPDSVVDISANFGGSSFPLNFDNSGGDEYFLSYMYFGAPNYSASIVTAIGTSNSIVPKTGTTVVEPLTLNTTIGSSSTWLAASQERNYTSSQDANFQGLGDRFIGCEFTIGANTHYGWIRVSVDASNVATIKDYAYESTPNTAILAGDTGSTLVLVNSLNIQGQGGISSISTSGGTLQMLANPLPSNANDTSVTWSVTNGTGSATIDSAGLLTAVSDGMVTVNALANDASGISDNIVITISNQSVGLSPTDKDSNDYLIYPNPASEKLTIYNQGKSKVNAIKLIDIQGKVLIDLIFDNTNSATKFNLDVNELAEGIYCIQIVDNSGKFHLSKFLKK